MAPQDDDSSIANDITTNNPTELSQTTNHVYIWEEEHSWIPAQVIDRPSLDTAVVNVPIYADEQAIVCDGGRTARHWNKRTVPQSALALQNVDRDGMLQVVEDMVDLPFLHEAAILYNLKARHIQSLPYTRTGDIIIAVNPYQWFHQLYSLHKRLWYGQALVWHPLSSSNTSSPGEDPRVHLPPHVYETSCLAYKGLLRNNEDQSILVSGESGAGKTETVKILLGDLASVQLGPSVLLHPHSPTTQTSKQQQKQHHEYLEENADDYNDIVKRVLDSNPLLEAFGNAKTLRNDNSSRFGKYLQLQFHRTSESNCVLAGSKCEVYLLEKSRVTIHDPNERTYHIFYQLLAAPDDFKESIWSGLVDTDNESFDYVGYTSTDTIEGQTDAQRFQNTLQALDLIGVQGETLKSLFRAICIVLQLGNMDFEVHPNDPEASQVVDVEELKALAELMGIDHMEQLSTALTVRTVQARSETFKVPLTSIQAQESADAFAKEIYARTFLWLVRTINEATCAEQNYVAETPTNGSGRRRSPSKGSAPPQHYGIIGLLDIFGFETFETNRFEQLCINYANEKLQQKFTQDVFQSVQVEYEMEGIQLEEITYDDNTDVLDLVEGKMGLLACLNEECLRPKGSDKAFVYKAQAMNKDNATFFRDLHAPDLEFGIKHFAGDVTYHADEFIVKNKDTLPTDLQNCAGHSTNAIVASELSNTHQQEGTSAAKESASGASTKKRRPRASGGSSADAQSHMKKRTSNLVAETVWTKFKSQLGRLMEALSRTKTRYIRCIKPNESKKPRVMEHGSTVEQLRCAGVVAAVTISRSAFPNRLEHMIVLERFKALWPEGSHLQTLQDTKLDPKQRTARATNELLSLALKEMEFQRKGINIQAFVMGKTRAYFRAGALEFLEGERILHLSKFASKIQNLIRGFVARTVYKNFRDATIRLQAGLRSRIAARHFHALRNKAVRLQCWYRVLSARKVLIQRRLYCSTVMIQTQWRVQRDRKRFVQLCQAACVVQTMVRGALQRPKYRQALVDKKEEAKLENQLRALQRKLEEAESKRAEAETLADSKAREAIEKYKEEARAAESPPTEGDNNEVTPPSDVPQVVISTTTVASTPDEDQQNLMDESGRMLEYLRKEVYKLRSQNQQLKTDFDLLKDNNQRLMDANASAGASFAALNQHAKQLSKHNTQLLTEVNSYRVQVQKLNVLHAELKDELKMKQESYIAEVQSRLETQKAMQKIVDLIQDKCRDHRLVEKILQVADECEMEQIGMGGDHHTPASEKSESKSMFGYLNFFSG
eukprot:Nitzschia sp. Nitz4//scaffold342_size18221//7904//11837//NITZ4_008795-RA/size18221-snap-gene-0.25-mRNA-1//-1//CDS//3329548577//4742//frame0